MSRPSEAVVKVAKQIAKSQGDRIVGTFKVPYSWKNRRIIYAATLYEAHSRMRANPDLFPNRVTRQQLRRAPLEPES
jgi:hypothetical protein